MNINVLGIDLAKRVFQLCALSSSGKVIFNRSVRREQLLQVVRELPATTIAMEACGTAHFWARQFRAMGHAVRLIPAQHVKAFCRVGKTDAKDALAICEAALRPQLHDVPVKSIEQQELSSLHALREGLVRQRTATINRLRAMASEYGVDLPMAHTRCRQATALLIEDAQSDLTSTTRLLLHTLLELWLSLNAQLDVIEKHIHALARQHDSYALLQTVPGIGPINSSAFIANVGNGAHFHCGRDVSAWLGVVPRLHGSGGKTQLHGITKNGNGYLRKQLVHGARMVVTWALRKSNETPLVRWIKQLVQTRGLHKTVLAYTNKMVRIAWAVVHHQQAFDINKAFKT